MDPQNEPSTLHLPPFRPGLQCDTSGEYRIFDPLRGRWLVLTPEEWVRQHFVNYLINHLHFPASFIANEVSLTLNDTRRRCDTLIYTRSLSPLCVVEYKRPTVAIDRRVFDQIARYNSVIMAPFLIVSNGMRHYCCQYTPGGYTFLKAIPTYDQMSSAIAR